MKDPELIKRAEDKLQKKREAIRLLDSAIALLVAHKDEVENPIDIAEVIIDCQNSIWLEVQNLETLLQD